MCSGKIAASMLLDLSPAPTQILARENPRARPRVRTSTQTPARTLTPARTRTPTKTPKRNRRGQQAVAPAGMRTGTLTPRRLHPRHSLQARCVLYSEFSTPISLSLSLSLARSLAPFLSRSLALSFSPEQWCRLSLLCADLFCIPSERGTLHCRALSVLACCSVAFFSPSSTSAASAQPR